jgi:hypothetical protein
MYSAVADQNPGLGSMSWYIQKDRTHYSEINNRISNLDINMWDIATNVIEPISFHLFDAQSNSTIQN